jgi:transcription-repair coupling factor (superfamily II helicase)
LSGSLDAVVLSSIFKIHPQDYVVVLHDKEEAAYFQNDLQNLLSREIPLFPMSYKRPYEFDEIENANVLMRTEVLNLLSNKTTPEIIVTYPEALAEKVINKRSLAQNTFSVKLKEKLDIKFLEEFLHSYDFEKTDFVYEAGQFAVRGGIIDIFSFAYEYPYRIELFGDEVDSIRTFDPGSQLSVEALQHINIIPNIQSKLTHDERQSFLEFIPPGTRVWFKDFQLAQDIVQKSFEKAEESFKKILHSSATQIISSPEKLFDNGVAFTRFAEAFTTIEFGLRFILPKSKVFEFRSTPQPSFNKNFELLAQDLFSTRFKAFRIS